MAKIIFLRRTMNAEAIPMGTSR